MSKKMNFSNCSTSGKNVKYNNKTSGKKVKYDTEPGNFDRLNPSWQFHRSVLEGKWNITCDDWKIFRETIFPKLREFETLTWAIIKTIPKTGRNGGNMHHNISVEEFTKEGKEEMEKQHLHYDELFSLRLDNKKRLFGILDKGVFHIVWYDSNHEIAKTKYNS